MTSNMQPPVREATKPWLMIIDMQRIFAETSSE
jgi:hypothetical protein